MDYIQLRFGVPALCSGILKLLFEIRLYPRPPSGLPEGGVRPGSANPMQDHVLRDRSSNQLESAHSLKRSGGI